MNKTALAKVLPHNKYTVITKVSVRLHVGVFLFFSVIFAVLFYNILKANLTPVLIHFSYSTNRFLNRLFRLRSCLFGSVSTQNIRMTFPRSSITNVLCARSACDLFDKMDCNILTGFTHQTLIP